MPDQPEQIITTLTEDDQDRLADQRAVVEMNLANEDSKQKYQTMKSRD